MGQADDLRPEVTSVRIYGSEYPLSSGESIGYTREIAAFVDHKMTRIASDGNLADATKVAIMAAMDIAGQLFIQKEQDEAVRRRTAEALDRLGRSLDEGEDVTPLDPDT
jgi:cell division protein ZapA (FtsZ GTPase activity inhibitor)